MCCLQREISLKDFVQHTILDNTQYPCRDVIWWGKSIYQFSVPNLTALFCQMRIVGILGGYFCS